MIDGGRWMTIRLESAAVARLALIIAVLACGCDPVWRISRSQVLRESPPPSCIEQALRTCPGISEIKPSPGSDDGRTFLFRSELGRGHLYVEESEFGQFQVQVSLSEFGTNIPPEVEKAAPVFLDELLNHVRSQCEPAARQ
jgi:hypothetical protein